VNLGRKEWTAPFCQISLGRKPKKSAVSKNNTSRVALLTILLVKKFIEFKTIEQS